jgi:TolA-binding protein
MTSTYRRRTLADALSVNWTPALEAQTKARIEASLAVRRRRGRRVVKVSALVATACAGSLVFAFARGLDAPGPQGSHREVVSPRGPTPPTPASSPSTSPAPRQPELPASAPSPERRSTSRRVRPSAPQTPAALASMGDDPIEALFIQADRARLAGRPNDALRPLAEIHERYPSDRRAAVAAFQLGRILADELGDPVRAAHAFDRAHELAPSGPLADDARARAEEARRAAAVNPQAGPTP